MKGKIGESRRGETKATEVGPGDEERRSQPVQSILAAHMSELE
jgi:hypothetical protein